MAALESAGLRPAREFAFRFPHELSGGQRQRVVIAGALVMNPELVVADEPVSMLDVSIRTELLRLMLDLRRDFGLTYLFITHDLSLAWVIADRIAVMYLGKIMEIGPAEAVIRSPRNPYTKALVSVSPTPEPADAATRADRYILQGETPDAAHIPSGCRFQPALPARLRSLQGGGAAAVRRRRRPPGGLLAGGGRGGAAALPGTAGDGGPAACRQRPWPPRCRQVPRRPRLRRPHECPLARTRSRRSWRRPWRHCGRRSGRWRGARWQPAEGELVGQRVRRSPDRGRPAGLCRADPRDPGRRGGRAVAAGIRRSWPPRGATTTPIRSSSSRRSRQARSEGIALVRSLSRADLARVGIHPEIGPLRVDEILAEWPYHDRSHVRQALAVSQSRIWPQLGRDPAVQRARRLASIRSASRRTRQRRSTSSSRSTAASRVAPTVTAPWRSWRTAIANGSGPSVRAAATAAAICRAAHRQERHERQAGQEQAGLGQVVRIRAVRRRSSGQATPRDGHGRRPGHRAALGTRRGGRRCRSSAGGRSSGLAVAGFVGRRSGSSGTRSRSSTLSSSLRRPDGVTRSWSPRRIERLPSAATIRPRAPEPGAGADDCLGGLEVVEGIHSVIIGHPRSARSARRQLVLGRCSRGASPGRRFSDPDC